MFQIIKKEIDNKKERNVSQRLNLITSHMYQQYREHVEATNNTSVIFERLLDILEETTEDLKYSFSQKNIPTYNVFKENDADRSVGILNILWHTISFTTRGNTKPLALERDGLNPLFTGRIIALNGDFKDFYAELQDDEYTELLNCEIASMYIPADKNESAIIRLRHVEKDILINQADAPKEFLLKVIEIICGGGIYHEKKLDFCE